MPVRTFWQTDPAKDQRSFGVLDLTVRRREVYGFCFTPQDGNSLLSSIAAALWLVDPDQDSLARRLEPLRRWLYREI